MPVNFAPQLPHKPACFGEQIHCYHEPGLYKDGIEFLRELAVRTGAIPDHEAATWNPVGSFAFYVDTLDGRGYIGFRPELPINVYATKESDV